ncbi:MAG: hypothetical protein D6785_11125, partial [Planctomycetota bacterium]
MSHSNPTAKTKQIYHFTLNGKACQYEGDGSTSLLFYLREIAGITSPKDGCSGQATCGACFVEINGKPYLSCNTPISKLEG